MKKREKEPLISICEEIEANNEIRWKKRRLNENIKRKEREVNERLAIEKLRRLEKAQRKKEELLERIKQKNEFIVGKNEAWIKKKQNMWRRFRENNGLSLEDEEEIRREILARIPERNPRKPDNEKDTPKVDLKVTVKPAKLKISEGLAEKELSVDQLSPELSLLNEGLSTRKLSL